MVKQQKYLITGAAGFIGSHLVELLLHEGIMPRNLRLLIQPGETLHNLPHKDFDVVYGDLRNKKDLVGIEENIDVVYHLAAVTMNGEGGLFHAVNSRGTKNLLDRFRNKKLQKFVFFSTIAIYGLPAFTGQREGITEESELRVVGEYADSKFKAEKLVMSSKLPYSIVRPTTVYGPRDKAGIYQLIQSIKSGYFFRIGSGSNKMDYVYVKDLVKGARLAQLSKRKASDYILGSARPVTFDEIVSTIYKCLNKSPMRMYIPRALGLVIGKIADTISKVLPIHLPISEDRVKVMTANYYFDSSKAKKEISYNPNTSFKKGITITLQWLQKES